MLLRPHPLGGFRPASSARWLCELAHIFLSLNQGSDTSNKQKEHRLFEMISDCERQGIIDGEVFLAIAKWFSRGGRGSKWIDAGPKTHEYIAKGEAILYPSAYRYRVTKLPGYTPAMCLSILLRAEARGLRDSCLYECICDLVPQVMMTNRMIQGDAFISEYIEKLKEVGSPAAYAVKARSIQRGGDPHTLKQVLRQLSVEADENELADADTLLSLIDDYMYVYYPSFSNFVHIEWRFIA